MAINRLNPDYPDAGTVQLIPTSVSVGSGSATVNGNGQVSFSGASSVTINGIFTSTYRNYYLTWESTGAAALYPNWRLAASGTANSTTNYQYQRYESALTGNSSQRNSNETIFSMLTNSTTAFAGNMYIFAPQVAEKTYIQSSTMAVFDSTFTAPSINLTCGVFNATTQFDGIQLLPNTSTITGTISIYGIRN